MLDIDASLKVYVHGRVHLAWHRKRFRLMRAVRTVVLGDDPPPVRMTRRAVDRLAREREEKSSVVHPGGSVILRDRRGELRWWTWAGLRANATLAASLGEVVDPIGHFDDRRIRLRQNLLPAEWRAVTAGVSERLCLPEVSKRAIAGLKFSTALPERLATAALAARSADLAGGGPC